MKLLMPLFLSLLLGPAIASAGTLYGTVRTDGGPASELSLMVACPSFTNARESPDPVPVDARGSFTVRVRANGRCEMRVRSPHALGDPFPVYSSNSSLRYDFQVDGRMNRVR